MMDWIVDALKNGVLILIAVVGFFIRRDMAKSDTRLELLESKIDKLDEYTHKKDLDRAIEGQNREIKLMIDPIKESLKDIKDSLKDKVSRDSYVNRP
jgi:hypothetical protein